MPFWIKRETWNGTCFFEKKWLQDIGAVNGGEKTGVVNPCFVGCRLFLCGAGEDSAATAAAAAAAASCSSISSCCCFSCCCCPDLGFAIPC